MREGSLAKFSRRRRREGAAVASPFTSSTIQREEDQR